MKFRFPQSYYKSVGQSYRSKSGGRSYHNVGQNYCIVGQGCSVGQTVGQGCIVGQGCSVGLRSVGQLDVQEVSAASPRKRRCVLPGAVPPLASAATATRTACGKGLRVRMLGMPPARWLRLLATPILLASAPPGLEAQVCGPPGRMYRALLRARPEADLMRTCSVLTHVRVLSTLASPVRAALPSPFLVPASAFSVRVRVR